MAGYQPYSEYKDSGVEWLGEVPKHWDVKRIKNLATYNDEALDESTNPDFEMEYVDISSVNLVEGITSTEMTSFEKAPSRARRKVKDGDTIVSTVRTYLKAIAAIKIPPENLIVSTGFAVIRPKPEIDSGYLGYLLQAEGFVGDVVANSVGVSYPAINASVLAALPAVQPDIEEQQTIARFLDHKTAQIDALIAKKEALLEKLAEKRTALISHAVTKGLNPQAKMKDSGVEWLGQVPEHWEVKSIKYLTKILRGKFTHRPRNDPRFYDGEYPFIQTGDIANASKYISTFSQTLNEDGLKVSKEFPAGTLVMTIAANIGDMAILDFNACFPDSIVGFVPKENVNLDFLYYTFVAMKQKLMSTAVLNTQLNLNIDRISSQFAALPPFEEQVKIDGYLESGLKKLGDQEVYIEKAIEKLKEYRSALITQAVTGKIDVRRYEVSLKAC